MPRYFYEVTRTETFVRIDPNDPSSSWRPATDEELQPKQPSSQYRLFSTHSDKGLHEIIYIWELVDTTRD